MCSRWAHKHIFFWFLLSVLASHPCLVWHWCALCSVKIVTTSCDLTNPRKTDLRVAVLSSRFFIYRSGYDNLAVRNTQACFPPSRLVIDFYFFLRLYCSLTNFVRPSPPTRPPLGPSVRVWSRLLSRRVTYAKNNSPCHPVGRLLINNNHYRSQPIEFCKAIFSEAFISRFLWTALIYHEPRRAGRRSQKQSSDIASQKWLSPRCWPYFRLKSNVK